MCTVRVISLLIFIAAVLSPVDAQVNTGTLLSASSEKVTTTNYYFARPNDLTIIVNVMGFVQRPGRYEIASSIDLVNLLSLTGGPMPDGDLDNVKISRMVKEGDVNTYKEMYFNLQDLSALGEQNLALYPGDIVTVDRTTWASVRDMFGVVVSAAIITTAITQIITVTRN